MMNKRLTAARARSVQTRAIRLMTYGAITLDRRRRDRCGEFVEIADIPSITLIQRKPICDHSQQCW
jgi:hypothetical protein